MRLEISADVPTVDLPKVVISVFAGYPSPDRTTIDVEILNRQHQSVCLQVDDPDAKFFTIGGSGLPSPYEDSDQSLTSYVGAEYGRIADYLHRDRTGHEDHFVVHCDVSLASRDASPGHSAVRVMSTPRTPPTEARPGSSEARDVLIANSGAREKVTGVRVLGSWCRIVRDSPTRLEDGTLDQLGVTVYTARVTCSGLYIWLFAPPKYRFEGGGYEVSGYKRAYEFGRVSFQRVEPTQYCEFKLWKGMIIGKALARNAKRITCAGNTTVDFRSRVSSPALGLAMRRRSFLVGAGMALSASLSVQAVWGLVDPAATLVVVGVAIVGAVAFLGLLTRGYRDPA